ncbi:unnamed protein product [Rhizophagus irregularis]|nr:unnamed protein product [Rhizophagus irregularis]CAB5360339.1 unnamed protein product [Rhizophagus irregularis]
MSTHIQNYYIAFIFCKSSVDSRLNSQAIFKKNILFELYKIVTLIYLYINVRNLFRFNWHISYVPNG